MRYFKFTLFLICISVEVIYSQNYQELQKLQEEYKKALERQSLQKPSDISEAENTAKSAAVPDKLIYSRKDIESLLVNTEKLLIQLKFLEDSTNMMPFRGYDFFTQRDTIPFWQNLPIPKKYLLGPGDEIIITLWGESNSSISEIINRDGQIFVNNIGILNLSGKTTVEAKKYILSKYSRVYSTLLGSSPKSFIDITLGELKSINIHFVGYVNIPGVHMVHPFSSVVTSLIQAGGVNKKGSLREINIIRNNEIISTIDIYNYIIKGKSLANVRLMDQDIIYVPPRKSTIPITGQVLMPGYYEILPNESIKSLFSFSGGKNSKSSKMIFLYKNNFSVNEGYLVDLTESSNYTIVDGDSIHVPLKADFKKFVNIEGQIKKSGKYPYNKDIRLLDIIKATSSLDNEDFVKTMNLSNILIHRKNPSGSKILKIVTNLEKNISLKNGDFITVPRNNSFHPIESIIITGEIKTPGLYPVNNLTSLSDILNFAGGYTDYALKDGVEIFRDSLKIAWQKPNFLLNDGDSLHVLKKSGLIFIEGEVNNPGFISFKKNDSIKKYINKAGGLTDFANPKNIYVVYPNGISFPYSKWSTPKVLEGSKIIVNQRNLSSKEDISGWQVFSIVSSQAGNLATSLISIALIYSQLK